MIELGKTYFNTAGRPVRIVCVDRKSVHDDYPILGLVSLPQGTENCEAYTRAGKAVSGCDLVIPQRYVKLDDVVKTVLRHLANYCRPVPAGSSFAPMRDELDAALHQLPVKELNDE